MFVTHKRYFVGLDNRPPMFNSECKGEQHMAPIDAAIATIMCLYNFERLFHVYTYTHNGMKNADELFTQNFDFDKLKKEVHKVSFRCIYFFVKIVCSRLQR